MKKSLLGGLMLFALSHAALAAPPVEELVPPRAERLSSKAVTACYAQLTESLVIKQQIEFVESSSGFRCFLGEMKADGTTLTETFYCKPSPLAGLEGISLSVRSLCSREGVIKIQSILIATLNPAVGL